MGRFIQPDTIIPNPGDSQAWNRFSYVLNNPIKYTDPTGHYVCEDLDCLDPGDDSTVPGVLSAQDPFPEFFYTGGIPPKKSSNENKKDENTAFGIRGEFTLWFTIGGLDINMDIVHFTQSEQTRLFITPGGQAGAGGSADATAGFLVGNNLPNAASYAGNSYTAGGDFSIFGIGIESDIATSLLPNPDGSFPRTVYFGAGVITGEGVYTSVGPTIDVYEEITKWFFGE